MLAHWLTIASSNAAATPGQAPDFSDCRIYAGPGLPGIKARCGNFERYLDPDDPGRTIEELPAPTRALFICTAP
jgi:hypothetical protein